MGKEDIPANSEGLEDADLDTFLTELAEFHQSYELKPHEFTCSMVLDRAEQPVDRSRVLNDLHARVKKGELSCKRERINGKSQYVFWVNE